MAADVQSDVDEATPVSLFNALRELRCRPRHLWLDLARADQSGRWRNGASWKVEEYFSQVPEFLADIEETLVLICGEIQLRREMGECPTVNEYQQRFPTLADEIAMQFDVDSVLDDGQPPFMPDTIGECAVPAMVTLPGFEFVRELGRGAAGIVYQARQLSLDRYVAIKVLAMPVADPKRLARQRQEAEILARLRHPNVVHVYEVLAHAGSLYLVMEYSEGTTLKDLANGKPLPARDAARLVLILAETMQSVHEAGVLHRDLKPSNVLAPAPDEIRITDFGLAKLRSNDSLLTTGDSVLGTPSYMSPEQALGSAQAAGPESDVYSLGAILYELLTGRPPFLGATVLETLSLIREQEPVPPRQLQPRTPSDLETICLHCLKKSASQRYATAAALANDLRCFLDGAVILARRSTRIERVMRWCRRKPATTALFGTVTVLIGVAVAILIVSNASIRREAAAKDAALATARQAVDQMLKQVADDKLSNMPLGHPLRAALLHDALKFYEGFLAQADDEASLREEMASVLDSLGIVERELGRFEDAIRSNERSIELLQSIVDRDPQPPRLREKVAAANEALAFTLSINRSAAGSREAVHQFRRTLELYQDLERDWPDRRQPVGLCLRRLANAAFKEGNLTEAEQFWRQAIERGEAFLDQQPANVEARTSLCWACGEVSDAILLRSNERANEAEPILKKGLKHSSIIRQQSPDSPQARDVEAFLHFCLARCYCRSDRAADATRQFQFAVNEIQTLCGEFPWNQQYWDSVKYFQRETVTELQGVDRADDARQVLREMVRWSQTTAPKLPADSLAQSEMKKCRSGLVKLLKATGQPTDAMNLESVSRANFNPRAEKDTELSSK